MRSERMEHLAPLTLQHQLSQRLLPVLLDGLGDGAYLLSQQSKLILEPTDLAGGGILGLCHLFEAGADAFEPPLQLLLGILKSFLLCDKAVLLAL